MADPRAHGIDISKYQGTYTRKNYPPRPVDFVIQRLSYGHAGRLFEDERYHQFLPAVQSIPVRGAYHYYTSTVGWRAQADFFISRLAGHQFFAWDAEKSGNTPHQSFLTGIESAMDYIMERTGLPGLIYSNPDMWSTWLFPVRARLTRFDLWIAQYWYSRALSNPRLAATMRPDWRFWQYDNLAMWGRGKEFGLGSLGGDLDVFNGTVAELQAWVGSGTTPPLPPPEDTDYRMASNVTVGLNIRSGPGATYALLGVLYKAQNPVVHILGSMNDYGKLADRDGWVYLPYLVKL